MATSGVTAWPLTARDMINAALHELRVIAIGEEPTSAEATACLLRLNALRKSWQGGENFEATATVTVPADSSSGILDEADVQDILSVRLITTFERPLFDMGRDRFQMLPNKAQTGQPTCYYSSQQAGGVRLFLWPVPAIETTLAIDYLRKPETVTDLSQTVDIPERYQEGLIVNLAIRCADMFGASITPEMLDRARRLERRMEDEQRPASYFMESEYARY